MDRYQVWLYRRIPPHPTLPAGLPNLVFDFSRIDTCEAMDVFLKPIQEDNTNRAAPYRCFARNQGLTTIVFHKVAFRYELRPLGAVGIGGLLTEA